MASTLRLLRPLAPLSPSARLVASVTRKHRLKISCLGLEYAKARALSTTPLLRARRDWNGRNFDDDPAEQLRNAQPLVQQGTFGKVARSPRTHTIAAIAVVAAFIFYFSNIQTVPVSGRRRFNCYSEKFVEEVAAEQVKRIVYEVERQGGRFLSDWDPRTRMVKRVMERLIPVSGMEDSKWEVHVIQDDRQANAFVLPGGKVFVYSGIIGIARNESGLATVLGHEIAHNLAQHMGEQMSSAIGINILLYSTIFLTALWGGALLGTQLFGGALLDYMFAKPMGRRQESEADYIGLMMMAEACYDPEEAVKFWQRMEAQNKMEPPEWMSTHPSNENRIEKIRSWMSQAVEKRQGSDCQGTSAFADMFRKAMERGTVIERVA